MSTGDVTGSRGWVAAANGPPTQAPRFAVGDSVGLLTIYIVLLIAIPSRLIFGPLGGAGTPASVLGIGLGLWWAAMRLAGPPERRRVSQPVRTAMLVMVATVLASYIAATVRPIDSVELRAADLGLLSVCSWLGVLLATTDGIRRRLDLDVLLRRLVAIGAALATLGIAQFITKQPFTNYIQIPGLTSNNALVSVLARGGLTRPAGTALHPIEFGAVLTMILPLAMHYAMIQSDRSLLARWFPVAAIATAVPISISRSAIVSTAIVLAFVLPTWTRQARRYTYTALVVLSACMYVTVPGLIGTITGLFTGISNDSSAQSRTDSYALAWEFISRNPIFGRGFPTFLPSYRILDDQYLGTLIDTGFVGLVALLGLFIIGVGTARGIRRHTQDTADRQLAQAMAASVASAGVSFALFDAFSFPMAAGLVYLVLGSIGALRRLAVRSALPSAEERGVSSNLPFGRDARLGHRAG